jgi:hypothetical protein
MVWLFYRMRKQVSVQDVVSSKLFITNITLKRFLLRVDEQMFIQIVRLLESPVTDVTN